MNGWKLMALDLDGTLLNEEGEVSTENVRWINKAKQQGVDVITKNTVKMIFQRILRMKSGSCLYLFLQICQ